MAYYLGIDGGGSKTTCAIGDEKSALATVVAGPSNITRVGEARARESLHQAIHDACAAARIAPAEIHRACVGAAGAGREETASAIRKIAGEVISGEIVVVGDMPIALEAAFGAGAGVIVSAGTGSFAYGRDSQGKTARAGGWGFAISDEGSAHWIGQRAVGEALREADKATTLPPLLEQLMRVPGERSFDAFVRAANSDLDFATLFPEVVSVAKAGDATARQVLIDAGRGLANLGAIVIGKLFSSHDSAVPLATAGSVFRHAELVCKAFYNQIRGLPQPLELKREIAEPVNGALQMARRSRG